MTLIWNNIPARMYWPVWVATSGPKGLVRGQGYTTAKEAADVMKERIRTGEASLGFVVMSEGDTREVLPTSVMPISARRIIEHFIELEESLGKPIK